MPVHLYGQPCNMDALKSLCDENNLLMVEDCAEALGSEWKGQKVGTFGDAATFSFFGNKTISTGEGGMIVTDDEQLAEDCRSLRNLCFQSSKRFVHERLGWNFRMTNMQAALGLAQLERLDEFVIRKRNMGAKYTELLADLDGVQLPLAKTNYSDNIYWVFGMILDEKLGFDAEEALQRLGKNKIGCRPFFYPMHQQPVLKDMGLFKGESYPVAERLYKQGFYIPSGMALTEQQIEKVAETVIDEIK